MRLAKYWRKMAALRRPRRVPSAVSLISSRFSKYRDMRKVNLKEIPEQERKSPKGKFGRASKNISVALGREPESTDLSKRHPFDLALVRIPKGKSLCPYHAHAAESELYLVVSGRGSVREKNG